MHNQVADLIAALHIDASILPSLCGHKCSDLLENPPDAVRRLLSLLAKLQINLRVAVGQVNIVLSRANIESLYYNNDAREAIGMLCIPEDKKGYKKMLTDMSASMGEQWIIRRLEGDMVPTVYGAHNWNVRNIRDYLDSTTDAKRHVGEFDRDRWVDLFILKWMTCLDYGWEIRYGLERKDDGDRIALKSQKMPAFLVQQVLRHVPGLQVSSPDTEPAPG